MPGTKWFGLVAVGALFAPIAARLQAPEPARARETIYYVASAGNDSSGAPNQPGRPYRSPSGAFGAIPADLTTGPGDHVIQLMDDSTYGQLHIAARVTDAGHRIVVRAAAGRSPTLDADFRSDGSRGDGTNNPVILVQADHVGIYGLHFINTNRDTLLGLSRHAGSEVMVKLEGSHSVIEGNYFDGLGRSPTRTDIFLLICNGARDNLIVGNRFDYSGGKSLIHITASCGGGSPGKQTIRNNVLSRFGNSPQAICAAINFGGQRGTLAGEASVVEHNTIHDNGGGCYGLLNTNGSTLTVSHNIFSRIVGHRYAIGCNQATGTSSGVATHSVMFGNTRDVESACWKLSGTTYADPHFVDPGASPPDLRTRPTGD
jgi:hypothetical protein